MNCTKTWSPSDQSGRLQGPKSEGGAQCAPPCKVGLMWAPGGIIATSCLQFSLNCNIETCHRIGDSKFYICFILTQLDTVYYQVDYELFNRLLKQNIFLEH